MGNAPVPKPALVFLCQRTPYPPVKGDRITSFNFLRHLTRRYRVFLGTFFDDPSDRAGIGDLRGMVEELYVEEIKKPWAYLFAVPRWLMGEPISFALFRSRGLDHWLDRIEEQHKPFAIVAYSSNISTYAVDKFRRNEKSEPRRILQFADVDSEKFVAYARRARGFAKWIFSIEAKRVVREERRLTALGDRIGFVTEEEKELFRSIHANHHDKLYVLPNGVDTEVFNPTSYPDAPFKALGPVFMFTGAMDYPPNIEAVSWFAEKVFPGIRKQIPNAQFLIVGSNPTAKVQQLAAHAGVMVTGRVPSAAAYLAHADVAVAPLQIARGVQNKVLEAMAMARAVIATPGAMTGIVARAGEHLVCAETDEEWINTCIELARDPTKSRQLGQAARQLMLSAYNWDAQLAKLDQMLETG